MKMKLITILILIGIIGLGTFKVIEAVNKEEEVKAEVAVPVTVLDIALTSMEDVLVYEGIIAPAHIEKISFKSTARLSTFEGEVGETLDAGTILATLDLSDLQLAYDAASSQLVAATADYQRANKGARKEDIDLASLSVEKASLAVAYLTKKVDDVTALVAIESATQSDLDGLKLELDLAMKDLELAQKNYEKAVNGAEPELVKAAKSQVALATTNLDSTSLMIQDATYTLAEKRILVERFYELGELVPAGYPVALLRSEDVIVTLGVTAKELDKIFVGQTAEVISNEGTVKGEVTRIAEIPDQTHFLYEVEVQLSTNSLKLGEIVECNLLLGKQEVVKVPIFAIMNDGIDYVYLVQDTIATVKKIVILGVDEGYAIVSGLSTGDQIVVSNLNRIHEQSKIIVEK